MIKTFFLFYFFPNLIDGLCQLVEIAKEGKRGGVCVCGGGGRGGEGRAPDRVKERRVEGGEGSSELKSPKRSLGCANCKLIK